MRDFYYSKSGSLWNMSDTFTQENPCVAGLVTFCHKDSALAPPTSVSMKCLSCILLGGSFPSLGIWMGNRKWLTLHHSGQQRQMGLSHPGPLDLALTVVLTFVTSVPCAVMTHVMANTRSTLPHLYSFKDLINALWNYM